jgi:hypothetical protein
MPLKQTDRIVIVVVCLLACASICFVSIKMYKEYEIRYNSNMLSLCRTGQILLNGRNYTELRKRFADPLMFGNGFSFRPTTDSDVERILRPFMSASINEYSSKVYAAWAKLLGADIGIIIVAFLILRFVINTEMVAVSNTNKPIKCAKCGKEYPFNYSGNFCEECGAIAAVSNPNNPLKCRKCAKCGKEYPSDYSGKFCEECGGGIYSA